MADEGKGHALKSVLKFFSELREMFFSEGVVNDLSPHTLVAFFLYFFGMKTRKGEEKKKLLNFHVCDARCKVCS
jgi:hypothetical protein